MSGPGDDLEVYGPALLMVVHYSQVQLPREACGVMWSTGRRGQALDEWCWIQNVAESPTVQFRFEPEQQMQIWQRLEDNGLAPALIWHSHPVGGARPSRTDVDWMSEPALHLIVGGLEPGSEPEVRVWRRDDAQGYRAVPFVVVGSDLGVGSWVREPDFDEPTNHIA